MSACLYCGGLGQTGDEHFVKKCDYCKGTGCNQSAPFKPRPVEPDCEACEGKGFTNEYCSWCSGSGEGCADGTRCSACKGTGNEASECQLCNGTGKVKREG